MFASVIYTLVLMVAISGFNVVYVSFFLKEHQVPLIFRNPDSSIYYDIQRAKILFFLVFIILSGIMCSLNFYDVDGKCLHTFEEDVFGSTSVDLYQYSLTALLWIVSLPMMSLFFMVGMRDNLKFGCYPVVIANIIFAFMLFILSQIVIISSIIQSGNNLIRGIHIASYLVLGTCLVCNLIYRVKYAKDDIAKEEEEVLDKAVAAVAS